MTMFAMNATSQVFAAEAADYGKDIDIMTDASTDNLSSRFDEVVSVNSQRGIYSDIEVLVYTGNKSDRWLHFTPKLPNRFHIRMVDYNNKEVWSETFYVNAGSTAHRFVGSNVKYVYLIGFPGGVVDITNTAH